MDEAKVLEYRQAITTAIMCAQLLTQHDIPQLLRNIERADAVGPILDPTLWREKQKAMDEDREVLKAANHLREIGLKLDKLRVAAGGAL